MWLVLPEEWVGSLVLPLHVHKTPNPNTIGGGGLNSLRSDLCGIEKANGWLRLHAFLSFKTITIHRLSPDSMRLREVSLED